MNHIYSIVLSVLFMSTVSCTNGQDGSFVYDVMCHAPSVSLAEVFEPIEFVSLDTHGEASVANVLKVCMSDDSFYILTVNPARVFKFNRNGHLEAMISREGRAEGEYLLPSDICFSKTENVLYIDDQARGILKFTENGEYVSTLPLAMKMRRLSVSDQGTLIINNLNILGGEATSLIEITQAKDTLFTRENCVRFNSGNFFYVPDHPSFKKINDGSLLFNPTCCDTIYTYSNHNLVPKYSIQFSAPVTVEHLKDFNAKMTETQFLIDYSEDPNNLYLTIFDKDWDYKQYVYDKRTTDIKRGEFYLSDSFKTKFYPRWQEGDYLIDIFDPSTLNYAYFKDIEDDDYENAYSFFATVGVNGLSIDSNPVLMITKAKQR